MQSKIPWVRNFVPHKVLHVPYEDPKKSPIKRSKRLSKKRRDAVKKGTTKKNKTHGGICPGWPGGGKGYVKKESCDDLASCIEWHSYF